MFFVATQVGPGQVRFEVVRKLRLYAFFALIWGFLMLFFNRFSYDPETSSEATTDILEKIVENSDNAGSFNDLISDCEVFNTLTYFGNIVAIVVWGTIYFHVTPQLIEDDEKLHYGLLRTKKVAVLGMCYQLLVNLPYFIYFSFKWNTGVFFNFFVVTVMSLLIYRSIYSTAIVGLEFIDQPELGIGVGGAGRGGDRGGGVLVSRALNPADRYNTVVQAQLPVHNERGLPVSYSTENVPVAEVKFGADADVGRESAVPTVHASPVGGYGMVSEQQRTQQGTQQGTQRGNDRRQQDEGEGYAIYGLE